MRLMLALAACTLVALAGCSAEQSSDTSFRAVVQRAGGSTLMAAANKPSAAADALSGGTLVHSDRGCVAIGRADGGVSVLLFPFGSKLAEDGESVDLPGTGVVRIGDRVEHGGGVAALESLADVPDECRAGDDLIVWS